MMTSFNGLGLHLGNISRLSNAQTRSISAENFTGEKGKGGMANEGAGAKPSRDLGHGWKVSPCIDLQPGETREIANIDGPGAIQQMWITPTGNWRFTILRIYWDDQEQPSVECPIGDFFACGWGKYTHVNSLPVCVNPGSAFNCYWEMPFRKRCRMTMENIADEKMTLFYQINYTLTDVPEDAAYFHAQFRRTNPLPYKQVYTILDGVKGQGQFVGCYMAWGANNNGWWGEGEIKFYIDGDIPDGRPTEEAVAEHGGDCYPTICGTGTEDYFCGSYCFLLDKGVGDVKDGKGLQYQEYTTAHAGMPQVLRPDGVYESQTRFGLYRWHIMDPVRFQQNLQVTMQALGWRSYERFMPLQDDIASVAYWYQTLPTSPFPELPARDYLEVI
jgi:hypothetical protein